MEGGPRPLFCNGLEGKRTFQKDIVKVENIAKNTQQQRSQTCATPLKEGHQETTVATPLPWNEMRTYILRRAHGNCLKRFCGLRGAGLYFEEVRNLLKLSRHAPTLRVAADLIAQRAVRRARLVATREEGRRKESSW